MAPLGLPRYALLKSMSNSKYVRHTNDGVYGSLRVNGAEAVSPVCKFELEMSEKRKGLFNIRSCYSNKYWVRESEDSSFLMALADKPNEDQSHWSCTLFEPVLVHDEEESGHAAIQLRCVHSQKLVELFYGGRPHCFTLRANSKETGNIITKFAVIDWESLVILPKRVAFKGDNGKYLRTVDSGEHLRLRFDSDDIVHPGVVNEITNGPDGSVHIKSRDAGKFWRRSPDWILADSDDTSSDNKDTLFVPVKTSAGTNSNNNTVALRNLGNYMFCKRHSAGDLESCLIAGISSITSEATLTVEEPVSSRSITDVKFRLADARILKNIVTLLTQDVANHTTKPQVLELKLTHTQTSSSTWDRSVSLKVGVATTIKAGVPFIAAEGQIEISPVVEGSLSWSGTKETSSEKVSTHTVIVPPMSKVTVSLVATEGKFEVPFSYTQRDFLPSGEIAPQEMDDGLYTGINTYYFDYKTAAPEPL